MPQTPQPGDPTYEEWKRMADSYGMSVDQLYQAMVSYPAEQGPLQGSYTGPKSLSPHMPAEPTPTTPYEPSAAAKRIAGTTPGAAAPPAQTPVEMYQGQRFETPGSAWNVPGALLWGAEQVAGGDLIVRKNRLQQDMDDAHLGLSRANTSTEVNYFNSRIQQIRQEYQQVVQQAKTGASGYHAAQTIAGQGMNVGTYGELRQEMPTGFNINLPLTLTEPGQAGQVGQLAGQTPLDPYGISPLKQILDPLNTDAAAQLGGQFGGTPPAAPAGGGGPQTYLGGQYGGAAPAVSGGAVNQYGQPTIGPAGGGAATSYGPKKTPEIAGPTGDGKGYATFKELSEARGGQTNVFYGSDPAALTAALGKSGSEVNRVYNPNVFQDTHTAVQRIDLGQGEQDYIVHRDNYGNVTSFSPT